LQDLAAGMGFLGVLGGVEHWFPAFIMSLSIVGQASGPGQSSHRSRRAKAWRPWRNFWGRTPGRSPEDAPRGILGVERPNSAIHDGGELIWSRPDRLVAQRSNRLPGEWLAIDRSGPRCCDPGAI